VHEAEPAALYLDIKRTEKSTRHTCTATRGSYRPMAAPRARAMRAIQLAVRGPEITKFWRNTGNQLQLKYLFSVCQQRVPFRRYSRLSRKTIQNRQFWAPRFRGRNPPNSGRPVLVLYSTVSSWHDYLHNNFQFHVSQATLLTTFELSSFSLRSKVGIRPKDKQTDWLHAWCCIWSGCYMTSPDNNGWGWNQSKSINASRR